MTVKEAILLAADEIGVGERVRAYFENNAETGKKETETLLRCFNIVENELALDYLPLYAEEEVFAETGAVRYAELTRPAVRILRVTDDGEMPSPSNCFPSI